MLARACDRQRSVRDAGRTAGSRGCHAQRRVRPCDPSDLCVVKDENFFVTFVFFVV
jgi:hypothetical protein